MCPHTAPFWRRWINHGRKSLCSFLVVILKRVVWLSEVRLVSALAKWYGWTNFPGMFLVIHLLSMTHFSKRVITCPITKTFHFNRSNTQCFLSLDCLVEPTSDFVIHGIEGYRGVTDFEKKINKCLKKMKYIIYSVVVSRKNIFSIRRIRKKFCGKEKSCNWLWQSFLKKLFHSIRNSMSFFFDSSHFCKFAPVEQNACFTHPSFPHNSLSILHPFAFPSFLHKTAAKPHITAHSRPLLSSSPAGRIYVLECVCSLFAANAPHGQYLSRRVLFCFY